MTTLFDAFQSAVVQFQDKIALIEAPSSQSWTYADLGRDVQRLAHGFAKLCNIRPGDRVGLLLPNQKEFVLGFFCASGIGSGCGSA